MLHAEILGMEGGGGGNQVLVNQERGDYVVVNGEEAKDDELHTYVGSLEKDDPGEVGQKISWGSTSPLLPPPPM